MNSKAEWHQPVVARVVVTRELEDQRQQAGGRRRTRGGAQLVILKPILIRPLVDGEGAVRERKGK